MEYMPKIFHFLTASNYVKALHLHGSERIISPARYGSMQTGQSVSSSLSPTRIGFVGIRVSAFLAALNSRL
uniref:Bm1663 n=1 Tax=Brugia malayi TaxID=6279 RepID=A0A1I9G6H8_BRUMA|nr:Bm1663 [Brugia malayi]